VSKNAKIDRPAAAGNTLFLCLTFPGKSSKKSACCLLAFLIFWWLKNPNFKTVLLVCGMRERIFGFWWLRVVYRLVLAAPPHRSTLLLADKGYAHIPEVQ
jgi:hypothetical protein